MALEEQTWIERVLIVFNPDGTLRGAQQIRMTAIFRDGVRMAADQEYAAEPLDGETLATALPAVAALTAQCAAQLTTMEAQQLENERMQQLVAEADRALAVMSAEFERLRAEVARLQGGGG